MTTAKNLKPEGTRSTKESSPTGGRRTRSTKRMMACKVSIVALEERRIV
jgi:hypothetical protein